MPLLPPPSPPRACQGGASEPAFGTARVAMCVPLPSHAPRYRPRPTGAAASAGHNCHTNALMVWCTCPGQHPDGSRVLALDAWVVEHCRGGSLQEDQYEEMADEEVDELCLKATRAVRVQGRPLQPQVRMVMMITMWRGWWWWRAGRGGVTAALEVGLGRPPSPRQRCVVVAAHMQYGGRCLSHARLRLGLCALEAHVRRQEAGAGAGGSACLPEPRRCKMRPAACNGVPCHCR